MSLVVSFAQDQTVAETVPTKTFAFTHQPQRDCGRLDETRVYGLTPQRPFALESRRGKHEVLIPAVFGLLAQFVESFRQGLTHWDGSLAGFGLGTVQNLPTSKNLLDGNSVFVPEDMTPAEPKARSTCPFPCPREARIRCRWAGREFFRRGLGCRLARLGTFQEHSRGYARCHYDGHSSHDASSSGPGYALEKHPELASFFDANKSERFFIKNLERVQGDEREAIIISIGYGKDRAGNLPLRFGPLLPEGGRRRLNVAVTRARQKLTVVSTFSYLDIDLSRVRPGTGVELLRNYLQYAASNGKRLGDADLTSRPLNEFEAEVFDCLSSAGLKLIPQMGASQYRIDAVVQHPTKPGRYVLAVEFDGATYHSSDTARDRDRLRQQQLVNLGWRFHRIWSTDWFMRKEDEIRRVMKAFEDAVRFADKQDREAVSNNDGDGNHREHAETGTATPLRGPRPHIPTRPSISQYTMPELSRLLEWITSDGQLRTDDQIIDEMVAELGFSRRGARIERALQAAIARWRSERRT